MSMGKQTNGLRPRVSGLGLGVLQANSSLFGPVALIYQSRQHRKLDSYDRYAGLSGRVELVHDGVKNMNTT